LEEKDIEASKVDLVAFNTKKSLWAPQPNVKGKMVYQTISSTLQKKECKMFVDMLKSIKTPTWFGATLHNSFNKEDFF
jgi:hypothetical protein